MDLEAGSLQPSVKVTLLAKLREYKTDLSNLKSEVKRVTSASVNLTARDDLLESGRADTLAVSLLYILPQILIGVNVIIFELWLRLLIHI